MILLYLCLFYVLHFCKQPSVMAELKSKQDDFTKTLTSLRKEVKVATDMMLWVQKMNNIRNRATEIVCAELIYKV